MTKEIKELFELTTQRVAQIEKESAREIAQIRKEAEGIRKKNDKETAQIRKETESIRKEAESNRKIAKERSDEDFKEIRKIIDRTEKSIEKTEKIIQNTASHLGFYTESVAKISEEYFYRGLKSNVSIGDMTFDTIVRNEHIDGKEYDIILENDKAVMLVSVKTNIGYSYILKLIYDDIVKLKKSSKYKSIDKKFYIAIAGFTGADKVLESAKKNGVLILTLSEEHQPTLINSEVPPKPY